MATVTEYGVRYSWSGGTHITVYGTCRAEAIRDAKQKPFDGQTIELVRRRVTYTEWTSGPLFPRSVEEDDV